MNYNCQDQLGVHINALDLSTNSNSYYSVLLHEYNTMAGLTACPIKTSLICPSAGRRMLTRGASH